MFGVLLAQHRRRRGRWLSISLRELFVVTSLAACGLGVWMHHVRLRQREEQVAGQFVVNPLSNLHEDYCGPESLHRLFPDELLADFTHVQETWVRDDSFWWQNYENRAKFLTAIHSLHYIRHLVFGPGAFEGLVQLPDHSDRLSAPDGAPGSVWQLSIDMSAFERIEEIDFLQFLVDDDVLTLVAELAVVTPLFCATAMGRGGLSGRVPVRRLLVQRSVRSRLPGLCDHSSHPITVLPSVSI